MRQEAGDMEYRTLGKTGIKVSTIGFGAWAIGGNMWGPQDDKDSISALNKAIDLGVNFIDTALAYGNGHSETTIGKVLKNRKERIYIATKIPPLMWPPPPASHSYDAFPKQKIIDSVESSLRNLNIDCIDLIQLHSWRENWTNETDWYETLLRFKEQGKIKHIGVSVHDNLEDESLGLIKTGRIETIQVVYNILAQTPRKNLFPKAQEYNIGIIARVPLAYGALTGKFTKETTFTETDFRKNKYSGSNLIDLLKKIERFKELSKTNDKKTLVSHALQFALNHPAVCTTIPGIRNSNQAVENCTYNNVNLPKDLIEELNNFTAERIH